MLEHLTHDSFAGQLNTPFLIQHGRRSVMIELIDASELRLYAGYESFSLVFRGPLDSILQQAIYPFHHDALGGFDLFIVPIRQDAQGFYDESVFNRLRQEPEV
jgi:hypothetical protein